MMKLVIETNSEGWRLLRHALYTSLVGMVKEMPTSHKSSSDWQALTKIYDQVKD